MAIDIPALRSAEQDLRAAIEQHILQLLRRVQAATDDSHRSDLMHELLLVEGLRARMDRVTVITNVLEDLSQSAPLCATWHEGRAP